MTDRVCNYPGNREDALVAYLYDDIAPADRRAFESHLASCAVCRAELSEFSVVRTRLGAWAPPEPTRALTSSALAAPGARSGVWAAVHDMPAWTQVAAAMLFLGLSVGAANLDVNYTADGLSVRTGWLSAAAPEVAQPVSQTPISTAAARVDPVSRDELTAMMRLLREEIGEARAADADVIRRVHTLIADSERKQENELALRSASLLQDIHSQRAADLVKIDRIFLQLGAATEREMKRQQIRTDDIDIRLARVSKQ